MSRALSGPRLLQVRLHLEPFLRLDFPFRNLLVTAVVIIQLDLRSRFILESQSYISIFRVQLGFGQLLLVHHEEGIASLIEGKLPFRSFLLRKELFLHIVLLFVFEVINTLLYQLHD